MNFLQLDSNHIFNQHITIFKSVFIIFVSIVSFILISDSHSSKPYTALFDRFWNDYMKHSGKWNIFDWTDTMIIGVYIIILKFVLTILYLHYFVYIYFDNQNFWSYNLCCLISCWYHLGKDCGNFFYWNYVFNQYIYIFKVTFTIFCFNCIIYFCFEFPLFESVGYFVQTILKPSHKAKW